MYRLQKQPQLFTCALDHELEDCAGQLATLAFLHEVVHPTGPIRGMLVKDCFVGPQRTLHSS